MQQTDIIKLRYAVAENVVSMLDQLTKSEAKQSGGEIGGAAGGRFPHQQCAGQRR